MTHKLKSSFGMTKCKECGSESISHKMLNAFGDFEFVCNKCGHKEIYYEV